MAASTVTPEAAPAGTSAPEKDVAASAAAPTEEAESSMSLAARAKKLMNSFKGTDTSKVEVTEDEQKPPSVEAGSSEEDALMAELEKLLVAKAAEADAAAGDTPPEDSMAHAAVAASKEDKLMCLRGRKYSPERAAELLPQMLQLKKDYDLDNTAEGASTDRLKADLSAHAVCYTGGKDSFNRGVLWLRFRFHNPKESKTRDLCRLVATVMLDALKDPDVQRHGIAIIHDMAEMQLSNLDMAAAKQVFGKVMPRLPIRVGRICVYSPPWIVGKVLLPFVLTFLSRKLKKRIVIVKGEQPENLLEHIPATALPTELGGQLKFDAIAWSDAVIAQL